MSKKYVTFFVLMCLMWIQGIPSKAKDLNLSFSDSCAVFRASVTGKPAEGVLESYRIELPAYKKALFYASRFKGFDGINQNFSWPVDKLSALFDASFEPVYNPQIQISAESETKRSIFREKDKTKRSKKESAQHSKSRNKSFVMTSVSAL